MALIDLDAAPKWFKKQSQDHMSADAARTFAKTDGVHACLTLCSFWQHRLLAPSSPIRHIMPPQARYSC
jgi:hypothetical protein